MRTYGVAGAAFTILLVGIVVAVIAWSISFKYSSRPEQQDRNRMECCAEKCRKAGADSAMYRRNECTCLFDFEGGDPKKQGPETWN